MKIAFNPSTVEALITPPNNKDITFDLRGQNIFARGVKFCGTDTNTWRDIKINNVSIGSNTLDLRNGSNTTLTNTNGVVTINSTWRPVVDNLTSDSTTSSLSAKQGKILKSLIDGKSNSGHTHDDRYLKLTGGTMASNALITFADSGSWGTDKGPQGARGGLYWTGQSDYAKLYAEETVGDNLDLVIQFGDDNSNGLSIRNKANTQTSYISAGGVITTGTFKGNLDWSYITNKPSSYTPSAHTHAWNSLTHSSTTENQAILTNGKANGWKLYTLNIARWDNAANNAHSHSNKSVLDGITSALVNNWNTAFTFVNTITGTDTDKVINKWDEIVNFLAGITEDNKLNTLLNSKLSVYKLADNTDVRAIKNNGIYYSTSDAPSGTLVNSPFNNGFTLINMTSLDNGDDLRRSRLAFNAYGEIKISDDRDQANTAETWYNVLTSKNSGISGSTIKLNGTSITIYSSSTSDGRYVKKSGDTMSGVLTIDTTNFGALTIKRNDDANGASIQFRGKSSVYGYIGLNNSTKDKQFLRWNSDTSKTYIILDTSSTYTSNGKGVINGTTITQVDNATNSTNSTNARKLVNWYSARPTSLNAQFGDGSLRIFYATSSTTEGKPAEDSHILHLAWDNHGGWDTQLAVHTHSGKVSTRAQNSGTWQPWKTLAFTTDIPSSLKNPYSLTTFGVVYDGSSAKTVTTSNFISQVNEGTNTVTDGTMLITSYASNSGFADTNAVNVPYKRKAIHLWEYVKAKTDSLYATKSHNHDDRYVRAFGTSNDNIDSDWGQSFKTFDPIPSGTPPEKNPNISLLSIGSSFNRRKQLAFIYNNDNIYYRRHVNNSFTNWRRLAFANEIPTSLKNPHALTISLNGTSQGPYDGSAAKNINITPGSIGAATSGHNHDGRYVYNYGGTQMDGASINKNALGMATNSGITGDWWHILQAAWNGEYRWNSQIAFPTQNRNGMYYRSGLDDNTKWGSWVKLLDVNNYSSTLDSRYYTKSEVNTKLGTYLPLRGGTMTGNIILKGGTSADMTYAGNVHPYIRFDNSDSSQNVSLIFTDYDTYRRPAGIKLVGNQGNEWFEAANIYATTFYGALSGNATNADKLDGYHASAFVKMKQFRFSQYNQGTWTKILTITINSTTDLQPAIAFSWIPSECSRTIWADFSINWRNNSPIFYAIWKGMDSRTLKVVNSSGAIWDVWVSGSKAKWDPFGEIQVTYTHNITSYNGGSLGYSDTDPGGTICITGGQVNYANSAGNADTLDNTHLNGIFTAFGNNAHNITATIGGVTKSFLVNWAADSDKLDGYHENSFLRYRETTSIDQENTLWDQIGIKQYNGALPDNLTNVYNYGSVISLPCTSTRFEIYASEQASFGNGLYYRSGWRDTKRPWLKFIDSSNIGSQSVNYANSAGSANSATQATNLTPENTPHYFRDPNKSIWRGGMYWGNAGDESMSFVVANGGTRFQFVGGSDIANWTSSTWQSVTPYLTIYSSGIVTPGSVTATNGFHHVNHDNNDAVLLAGGGYSQGVPVKYWSIESITIYGPTSVSRTNRGGNYTFVTKVEPRIKGSCSLTLQFPSGYNNENTIIWAMGVLNKDMSNSAYSAIYATMLQFSGSKYYLNLSDDYSLNNGACQLYFMCF